MPFRKNNTAALRRVNEIFTQWFTERVREIM